MKEKLIALTFDDGPNPIATPLILELLKTYHAKGTFFVVGYRLDKYPDLVKREIRESHEVANHTNLHTYFKKNTSKQAVRAEIQSLSSKFEDHNIQESPWFRPPGGYYNDIVVQVAKELGYHVVLWSWHQDTKDWSKPGVDKIIAKVLDNARNGDIVLMHDHVGGSMQTVEALKKILPELQRRGFKMVTVSELVSHGIME
nr:polysaccharide deacetylase family protein [Paenibacillus daejeonensis]